jgi:hypothetical protein
MHSAGALTIPVRVKPEQDTDNLRPLGALFGRIEKANIKREVLSIIVRHTLALRRLIGKRGACHCAGSVLPRGFVSMHDQSRLRIPGSRS